MYRFRPCHHHCGFMELMLFEDEYLRITSNHKKKGKRFSRKRTASTSTLHKRCKFGHYLGSCDINILHFTNICFCYKDKYLEFLKRHIDKKYLRNKDARKHIVFLYKYRHRRRYPVYFDGNYHYSHLKKI